MSDQLEDLKPEDLTATERPVSIPSELPILPLRDTVLFPNSFMPLAVARESSVRLIDDAIANGKLIAVFTQRDASVEEPVQEDLYAVGCDPHHKMFKLPDWPALIVRARAPQPAGRLHSPSLRARVSGASGGTNVPGSDRRARALKTTSSGGLAIAFSRRLQTLAMNIAEPGGSPFHCLDLSTISNR
jgi:hypothetical protein